MFRRQSHASAALAVFLVFLLSTGPVLASANAETTPIDPVAAYNEKFIDFCGAWGIGFVSSRTKQSYPCQGVDGDRLRWKEFYGDLGRPDIAEQLVPSWRRELAGYSLASGIFGLLASSIAALALKKSGNEAHMEHATTAGALSLGAFGLGVLVAPWGEIVNERTYHPLVSRKLALQHNDQLAQSLGLVYPPQSHLLAKTPEEVRASDLSPELAAEFRMRNLELVKHIEFVFVPDRSPQRDSASFSRLRNFVTRGESASPLPWPEYYHLVDDPMGIHRLEERAFDTKFIFSTGAFALFAGVGVGLPLLGDTERSKVQISTAVITMVIGLVLTSWGIARDPAEPRAVLKSQVRRYNQKLLRSLQERMVEEESLLTESPAEKEDHDASSLPR